MTSRWDDRFADRYNELVIIGQELDIIAITAALDDCLCTEPEVKSFQQKAVFNDPFPVI